MKQSEPDIWEEIFAKCKIEDDKLGKSKSKPGVENLGRSFEKNIILGKFKVGDRVQTVTNCFNIPVGMLGTIIGFIDPNSTLWVWKRVHVDFDENQKLNGKYYVIPSILNLITNEGK